MRKALMISAMLPAMACLTATLAMAQASYRAASGTPSVAGTWIGKLKAKHFPLTGIAAKPQTDTLTFTIVQSGGSFGAGTTFSILRNGVASPDVFISTGQTGNGNLGATGSSASEAIIISAHVNKTATSMKGIGIIYSADAVEDVSFTLNKQ